MKQKRRLQFRKAKLQTSLSKGTSAINFTSIAKDFESKKDYFSAFKAFLWAFQKTVIRTLLMEHITDSKKNYLTNIATLEYAIDVFSEIKKDDSLKSKVKDKSDEFFYLDYSNKVKYAPV